MGILDTLAPATCASCTYWHDPQKQEVGQCRRHAPLAQICDVTGYGIAIWPRTDATDTCGDWDRRLEALQP